MGTMVILACCFIPATTGCRHQIETYRQNNVSAGELRSPFQSVFAHISQYFYLTVDGKTYKNVCGFAPFFLDVPELNSILFVTGDETDGTVKFHIVSRDTGHEIVIGGGQSHFGAGIGGLEPYKDSVQLLTPERLALISEAPQAKLVTILNFSSKTVESIQRQVIGP